DQICLEGIPDRIRVDGSKGNVITEGESRCLVGDDKGALQSDDKGVAFVHDRMTVLHGDVALASRGTAALLYRPAGETIGKNASVDCLGGVKKRAACVRHPWGGRILIGG